ncbi:MAG: MFS transporter [Bacillota bacterium]|nr:MFS transporter [Bacillota bacterium]
MFEKNRYSAVSLNYFLFFALSGTFIPFIFIYLQSEGWSGVSIGIYSAIGPLVAFLVQPIWGYIADRRGRLPLMFAVLILLSGAIISIYKNVPVGPAFYVLAILLGIFQNPLNPMIDSMSIRALGEQKNSWGLTRLWGSLGFAVSSFIMGKVFTDSPALIFTSYGVGTIFVALAIFVMPFEEKKRKKNPFTTNSPLKVLALFLQNNSSFFLRPYPSCNWVKACL